jgi:hypothetical protein
MRFIGVPPVGGEAPQIDGDAFCEARAKTTARLADGQERGGKTLQDAGVAAPDGVTRRAATGRATRDAAGE